MSAEENKRIVQRYWLEVINQEKLDVIDEIFAPSYILHDYSLCGTEGPRGRDDVRKVLKNFREWYPDLRALIEEQIVEGNRVVTRYTTFGTHKDTHKHVVVGGINISCVDDGMVTQAWNNWDAIHLVDHEENREHDEEERHWCWWC
jgi:predicted SnoaL-like aldol condensation-catalyzing enzyme